MWTLDPAELAELETRAGATSRVLMGRGRALTAEGATFDWQQVLR